MSLRDQPESQVREKFEGSPRGEPVPDSSFRKGVPAFTRIQSAPSPEERTGSCLLMESVHETVAACCPDCASQSSLSSNPYQGPPRGLLSNLSSRIAHSGPPGGLLSNSVGWVEAKQSTPAHSPSDNVTESPRVLPPSPGESIPAILSSRREYEEGKPATGWSSMYVGHSPHERSPSK